MNKDKSRIFKFRTKIEAIATVSLLILMCMSAVIGNRVITDSSDNLDTMIRNSNGKSWSASGANLQLAIWDLNGTGGTVWLSSGIITSTTNIEIIDNIYLIGQNTTIIINSNSAIHGITISNVVNTTLKDLKIIRSGVVGTAELSACYISGTSNGVELLNCELINSNTGANYQYGLYVYGSNVYATFDNVIAEGGGNIGGYGFNLDNSHCKFYNCEGIGGSGGIEGRGIMIIGSDSSELYNCIGTGGNGGTGGIGIMCSYDSSPLLIGCKGIGGNNGKSSVGIALDLRTTAILQDCIGIGGIYDASPLDSDNCGISIAGVSSPLLKNCIGEGGTGFTGHGIFITNSANPTLISCTGIYGGLTYDTYALSIGESSSPLITGFNSKFKTYSDTWNYDDADNGRFQPFGGMPYQLYSITVLVNSINLGVVLDIGTSIGNNDIANDIPISSTGFKDFNFIKAEINSGNYLYATPSNPIDDSNITIYYSTITNYYNNFALYLTTTGYTKITSSTFISNGNSNAMYLYLNADNKTWNLSNCYIETLDPANNYSIRSNNILNNISIHNCVLIGPTYNINGFRSFDVMSSDEPLYPIRGSYWFNATTGELGIYNGTVWFWK